MGYVVEELNHPGHRECHHLGYLLEHHFTNLSSASAGLSASWSKREELKRAGGKKFMFES